MGAGWVQDGCRVQGAGALRPDGRAAAAELTRRSAHAGRWHKLVRMRKPIEIMRFSEDATDG